MIKLIIDEYYSCQTSYRIRICLGLNLRMEGYIGLLQASSNLLKALTLTNQILLQSGPILIFLPNLLALNFSFQFCAKSFPPNVCFGTKFSLRFLTFFCFFEIYSRKYYEHADFELHFFSMSIRPYIIKIIAAFDKITQSYEAVNSSTSQV